MSTRPSRFAVLAEQSGRRELIPPGLMNALYGTIHALWNRIPPPGGIRQDVRRKLDDPNSIITDNELFIFAIAADLRAHERISRSGVSSSTVGDILGAARSVLQQKVVPQEEGGWLFQPGVWAEFSEYAYAGHEDKVPGMAPFPLADVAEDTSHSTAGLSGSQVSPTLMTRVTLRGDSTMTSRKVWSNSFSPKW